MKKFLFFTFLCTMFSVKALIAQEAYVVFEDGILTFYYDNQRASRTGTKYDVPIPEGDGWETPGWSIKSKQVTKVIFDSSFANANPTSNYMWFIEMTELTTISGIEYLNTSAVTDMTSMFYNCKLLTNIDLSHFNTSNVKYMGSMFSNCEKLTDIDLSNFNTSNVKDMSGMFNNCISLTNLNMNGFSTANATSMNSMFNNCSSLKSLDLSSFSTANVTGIWKMFYNCVNLKTIYVSNEWSTENVTLSYDMFYNCTSLVGGQGTKFDALYTDAEYACIDDGIESPGYFTYKAYCDLNSDMKITAADIQVIINEMKKQEADQNIKFDLNRDDRISAADIQIIINEMKK